MCNVAEAGDTLDNMTCGAGYSRSWQRTRPPLEETLEAVRTYRPRIVLQSVGGNEFAGDELLSFLHHRDSEVEAIRRHYADCV